MVPLSSVASNSLKFIVYHAEPRGISDLPYGVMISGPGRPRETRRERFVESEFGRRGGSIWLLLNAERRTRRSLFEKERAVRMGILQGSMAKQILTFAKADELADLLKKAPEKPQLERPVDLDAFVQRLYPMVAKKIDEDGRSEERRVGK